jgi:hypothetical protein
MQTTKQITALAILLYQHQQSLQQSLRVSVNSSISLAIMVKSVVIMNPSIDMRVNKWDRTNIIVLKMGNIANNNQNTVIEVKIMITIILKMGSINNNHFDKHYQLLLPHPQ